MEDDIPRLKIRDLPLSERPRERAKQYGMGALSNAELLQLVTGVGYLDLCPALYTTAGSLTAINRMTIEEIADLVNGLGEGSAVAIKAALELGRRLMIENGGDRAQIRSPADAANILMSLIGDAEQEHLVVMLLDTKNRVIATPTLYIGNVNTSIIRTAEIFRQAVRRNAVGIIVAHNHPSGDPSPSPEDVQVTEHIVEAGKLMDIDVLDHLVIGKARYVSMKERRLGF
ncbi:MAG: DNA repair protein RadC [Anaerolineae bacterium]|nr:DNA repair protein RadC [Anaerolineae bacterium]